MPALLGWARVPAGWRELVRRVGIQAWQDNCLGWAAQLAFYFFLALFPALLFLVALASFFPIQNLMDEIIGALARFAPSDVLAIVRDQIQQIALGQNGGLLTLGILGTVWSSSSGMLAIIDTLNSAYHVHEGRSWWRVRLTAIALTVALAIFIVLSFTLVLGGIHLIAGIAERVGASRAAVIVWAALEWPLVAALAIVGVGLVYYFAPDVKQEWFWMAPGTIVATGLWLVISLGFKWYVANFGAYNKTYGAIGGVIVLMLWFYLSGLAILLGAEVNAVIEHASVEGKSPGEKVAGQGVEDPGNPQPAVRPERRS